MTKPPTFSNPLGVNPSGAWASKRLNESRKTQRMTSGQSAWSLTTHSVAVAAVRNNRILPATTMVREVEKATARDDRLSLSFREAFGVLGVPMLITLAACILWTTWLIVVALAPNEAANWLMGTGAYDNGHFWLIVDTNPTMINAGTAGLVFVDVCYLYVVVKMLRWRKTVADIQLQESWFEPESRRTPYPYPWMDTARDRCKSYYTDLTSFRGSRRKFLNVCMKISNLSMQMIVLLELLDNGNPATLVYGYTLFLSVSSLAGAVKIIFGKFTAMGEIIAGSVFDLFAAIIHPFLVLEYCYYNFQFDDAVFGTYLAILPSGSFERTARVLADASEIALFRLNFDSLRIRSVLDFVLRVGINLSFCYRIKRISDVLISIHLRRLQSVRIRRPKPVRVQQRPVPRVFATVFIAFSVFVWIFSSQAIKDTRKYCSKYYPQCVVYAYRWGAQGDVCPCRILIDVDPAPKTYKEWIHPIDAYDAVQALSLSGELRSLQFVNRQLLELPEELRACRYLTSVRLIYTSIQSLPSWAKEFKYLETLHVEGKLGSQNLAQLPEDLFSDMGWLSTVHIGVHRNLRSIPPLAGVPNLQSLTLAWLLSLRELPPFDHIPRLERLILTFLPRLERIPNMSPLESLSDFTLSRPVQLCCNGFRGSCDLGDNYCVENPIAAIPAATCLDNDPFLGDLGTEAAFDKFEATICQKLPSDLLLVAGAPTRQTIESCESKPFGQCQLPSGGTGICYNTRMQVLSCYRDENYIKLRRHQIQLGVGSTCDPVLEKWLGCSG